MSKIAAAIFNSSKHFYLLPHLIVSCLFSGGGRGRGDRDGGFGDSNGGSGGGAFSFKANIESGGDFGGDKPEGGELICVV